MEYNLMTWAGENSTSGIMTYTEDGSPGVVSGSDGQVLVWEGGPVFIEQSALSGINDPLPLPGLQVRRDSIHIPPTSHSGVKWEFTDYMTSPTEIKLDVSNPTRVYVGASGGYYVGWNTGISNSSTETVDFRIKVNGSSVVSGSERQFTFIDGEYHIGDGLLLELENGDYIELETQSIAEKTRMYDVVLSIFQLKGPKGDRGKAGSGSTLSFENSSVPVVNTPHSGLNTKPPFLFTDGGAGLAELSMDIPSTLSTTTASGSNKILIDDGQVKHITFDDFVGSIDVADTVGARDSIDSSAIHDNVNSEISAITSKSSLVANDIFLIEDSQASNAKKSTTLSDISGIIAGDISSEPRAWESGATNTISTSSSTLSAMPNMSITPGEVGSFAVTVTLETQGGNNRQIEIQLFGGGVANTNSLRRRDYSNANALRIMATSAIIDLSNPSDTIELRWRKSSGSSTVTVVNRHIMAVKVDKQ